MQKFRVRALELIDKAQSQALAMKLEEQEAAEEDGAGAAPGQEAGSAPSRRPSATTTKRMTRSVLEQKLCDLLRDVCQIKAKDTKPHFPIANAVGESALPISAADSFAVRSSVLNVDCIE